MSDQSKLLFEEADSVYNICRQEFYDIHVTYIIGLVKERNRARWLFHFSRETLDRSAARKSLSVTYILS